MVNEESLGWVTSGRSVVIGNPKDKEKALLALDELFKELEKGLNKVFDTFGDMDFDEDVISEIIHNKV